MIKTLSIIGSGHAAKFFGHLFQSKGLVIENIISRNTESGSRLAQDLNSHFSQLYDFELSSDLVLLCVKDDAIQEFVANVKLSKKSIIAHCAGSVSLNVLSQFEYSAVLYPLQSLKGELDAEQVPFLIEASDEQSLIQLKSCLEMMQLKVVLCESEQRKSYHLAAVFANNFTNAILGATEQLSDRFHLDFELLKPLIEKTFKGALIEGDVMLNQTGPAKRNDWITMQQHQDMLAQNPALKSLYIAISEFILNGQK